MDTLLLEYKVWNEDDGDVAVVAVMRRPCDEMVRMFSESLRELSRAGVAKVRRRVVAHFGAAHPFVDVIDGHIAWRDIFGRA